MTEFALPPGWQSKRLKHLATYNDEVLAERTYEEKEIDYVEISGVSLSRGIEVIERMTFRQAPSRARRKVRTGDILISTVRTYLRAIAKIDEAPSGLIASTGFCVVRPNDDADSGFLGWAAKSEPFVSEVVARSVGVSYPAINPTELVTIDIPLPPLHTQRRIAQFLDEKTARIDGLIKKKQELLDCLAEKRQALITRAVTKGLNPASPSRPDRCGGHRTQREDCRVTERDEGMTQVPEKVREAYRELPSGWKLEKLKFFAAVRNSNVDKTISEDEEPVRLCNYTDVYYNDRITPDLQFMDGSATKPEIERFQLKCDQVIITKDSEGWDDIGIPALVAEDMPKVLCGYHLSVLEPGPDLDGGFLAWLCRAEPLNDQFKLTANGITRFGLGQYAMKNAFIALPPFDTQRRIARFLDKKTLRIKGLMEKITCSIDCLEEYRTATITAAVTGQYPELR